MKAWYAKILGGVPGKCARGGAPDGTDCVDVPGVSLAMSQGETKLDPTAGRSLDHIGFEVKNLPEFLKRMEAEGVTITQGLTASNFVSTMRVAFIADPWGTKMEITEGTGSPGLGWIIRPIVFIQPAWFTGSFAGGSPAK